MAFLMPGNVTAGCLEAAQCLERGEPEQARVRLAQLVADLKETVSSHWTQGRRQVAEGDLYGALESFGWIVALHGENVLQVALPVTRAACYGEIAGLLRKLDQPFAAAVALRLAGQAGDAFYRPVASCQIPILDGLLEALFGKRADGVFVEVGACDGETFSNTSCLADLGWRGVYVEPVDRMFEACRARHARNPRVSVLNAAVGATVGTTRIWDFGASSRNEPDPLLPEALRVPDAAPARALVVPQRRLDDVLAETGIAPGFDLLVVDVEGMEEAVFAGFELARWRPRAMIVELIDQATIYAHHTDAIAASRRVRAALHDAGYEAIYRDHCNTVFRDAASGARTA